jgi:hypothetical protein
LIAIFRWGRKLPEGVFAAVFWAGILVVFLGIIFSVFTYLEYSVCRNARVSGDYETIEGVVAKFIPMPYYGKAVESFVAPQFGHLSDPTGSQFHHPFLSKTPLLQRVQ